MSLFFTSLSLRPAARCLASASRSFSSTTPSFSSHRVPPESPSYIRLPPARQAEVEHKPRIRGFLPVPRKIFHRADGSRKVQESYITATAPRRKPKNKRKGTDWDRYMAGFRRMNLRKGLGHLYLRHRRDLRIRRNAAMQKFSENRALAAAPERKDDRVTRGTVLDALMDTKLYPDPDRFRKAERSRAKVIAREDAKRQARGDALMELYINATSFIVDEAELKTHIEKEFAEDFFRKQSDAAARYGAADNVWGVQGKPPGLAHLMEASSSSAPPKLSEFHETEYDRSAKRQKKIAEEFTGGKMD